MQDKWKQTFWEIWHNYRSEVGFFFCLSLLTVSGHWLSHFIPVERFENEILLIEHGATTAICIVGAWLLFTHSDGLRIRRACAYALAAWGLSEVWFLLQTCWLRLPVLAAGSEALTPYMLFAGNFLGWLLLVYPTETLRPGWLTWKLALWQLLPLAALCAIDYMVPYDLRWIIGLYPVALFILVITHIRAYRIWCENNYSSMDHSDAQWVVRYLIMLLVIGVSYCYIMASDNPCRTFTQNLLLQFMFVYSISEILFRQDPWRDAEEIKDKEDKVQANDEEADRIRLEQWLDTEKPYLRTDFKLIDLMEVLPMNRTYLSEFINKTYGCSFYQFVTRYRIEEAKRLMQQNPEMKIGDVAFRSGFSSPAVFSHTFSKETGMTPREWGKGMR